MKIKKLNIKRKRQIIIDLLIMFILFVAALVPRLLEADLFVNIDGAKFWFIRTENFYRSLKYFDFVNTFQTAHPAVTLMWLSGASMLLKNYFLGNYDLFDFSNKAGLLFAAKLPIILITSITISFVYFLIKKLFNNRKIGLFCSLFILINPFYLAHSRFFQMDALLGSFSIFSILLIFIFLQNSQKKYLIFSGIFAGLAILTKTPALILIFYFLLLFYFHYIPVISNFLKIFRFNLSNQNFSSFYLWFVVLFSTFFILWPAAIISPITIIKNVFYSVVKNVVAGDQITVNSANFYPIILFTRLSFFSLICFIFGIIYFIGNIIQRIRNKIIQKYDLIEKISFSLLFFIFS